MKLHEQVDLTMEDLVRLHTERNFLVARNRDEVQEILRLEADTMLTEKQKRRLLEHQWSQQRDCVRLIAGIDKKIRYELEAISNIINFIAKGEAE